MASLIPGFGYDIFISYRQKDNKYDHWVTEFVSNLRKELESAFKEEVSVYFDENPHDGLLETHDVADSVKEKLKCLIFIPIVSRTYCDSKSFAWQHEFKAFIKQASGDSQGLKIKLNNGNVASRILPIRIHDLDPEDANMLERELEGPLRPIDFLFRTPGVNRPLRSVDSRTENDCKLVYRDQINKVGNSIRELINGMRRTSVSADKGPMVQPVLSRSRTGAGKKWILAAGLMAILLAVTLFVFNKSQPVPVADVGLAKSIAVLPFKNLSGDPEQDYFSDGITEEIINAIAQIKELKVPGRSSSFSFRGKEVDLKEIGAKLNVATVLEGSVRKQGDRVKIDAQIVSVKDGFQLWSQQFDRKLTNVFAIQEEIAQAITNRLKVTFLEREKIEMGEGQTGIAAAHDALLRGRYFWNRRELKESEKYFKRAIELDPGYASAYAGLAETYVIFPFFHTGSPAEAMPKAEQAAKKAIALDSTLSGPYFTLGYKNGLFDLNPVAANKYFAKGHALNPNSPQGHYWRGQFMVNYESPEEAVSEMQRAVELEPQGSYAYFNLGIALTTARRFEPALAALKTSAELNKQNGYAFMYMGHAYMGLGQTANAQAAYERAAALSNDQGYAVLVYLLMKSNNKSRAVEVFDKLVQRSLTEYVSKVCLALGAYSLDRKDIAYDYLLKALETHDIFLAAALHQPGTIPGLLALMTDPKSKALIEQHFKNSPIPVSSPSPSR